MQQALPIRTKIQLGIYTLINPFVRLLIRLGLTPNMVTTIGLILNIGVALIFIIGAKQGNRGDFSYIGWAGALVLFAGLFDMLDGQVARLGKMSSLYGALFDSVLDRYSELIMFLGICYYLIAHHYFFGSLTAFVALIGSIMVSYTRARAEGLGIESKGGLMQRPERVITIGVSALACGCLAPLLGDDFKVYVPGISVHIFETMTIFTLPLTIMAIMTNLTAYNRLMDARKALEQKEKPVTQSKEKVLLMTFLILASALGQSVMAKEMQAGTQQEKPKVNFPVPKNIPNQLFYLQRDPNPNTIICALNLKNGQLDKHDPVHVFWIRYTEQSQQKELSYLQRTFAYGIKARPLSNEEYELNFVSYKKFPLHLVKTDRDNYYVYATVNQKKVILKRLYLHIEGGTFWVPNVKYIQVEGINASTGEATVERVIV